MDRHKGIGDAIRVLCGRLLVASIVAGLDAPTKVLLHGMKRAGWGATTKTSAGLAHSALRGMIEGIADEAKQGKAETVARIGFWNARPWFSADGENDPGSGVN
jgi:hypothetical protein